MNDSRFKPEAGQVKLVPWVLSKTLARVHVLTTDDNKSIVRYVLLLPPHQNHRHEVMCELFNNN